MMILEKSQMNTKGKSWWGAKASVLSAFAPVCEFLQVTST